MIIDIQQIRKEPVTLDVRLEPEFLMENVEEDLRFEAAEGTITFTIAGKDVQANGKLHSRVHGACGRCLAEAVHELDVPVHLNFWPRTGNEGSKIPDLEPDEPDYSLYDGTEIHPDEDLRQLVLVEVPTVLLCRRDCRGLCPQCGANRNETPCACQTEEEDQSPVNKNGWKSQLRKLDLS